MFHRPHVKAFWVKAFGTCAALLTLTAGQARAGATDGLAAHRAVYDLVLKNAGENSGIEDMYGRMVYEFTGSACRGYNVNFRFVTAVDMDGEHRTTDQQTSTFEDLKNRRFSFETKTYSGETLNGDVSGEAKIGDKGLEVSLKGTSPRKIDLAASIFPTEQMLDVIERARDGEHMFETRVFDGSDTGDKALYTTTVVGAKVQPAGSDGDSAGAGALATEAYWPVTVAYFNDKSGADQLPSYRVSFKLYENGITRDLTMDYGDFVLTGKLTDLQLLKKDSCE